VDGETKNRIFTRSQFRRKKSGPAPKGNYEKNSMYIYILYLHYFPERLSKIV